MLFTFLHSFMTRTALVLSIWLLSIEISKSLPLFDHTKMIAFINDEFRLKKDSNPEYFSFSSMGNSVSLQLNSSTKRLYSLAYEIENPESKDTKKWAQLVYKGNNIFERSEYEQIQKEGKWVKSDKVILKSLIEAQNLPKSLKVCKTESKPENVHHYDEPGDGVAKIKYAVQENIFFLQYSESEGTTRIMAIPYEELVDPKSASTWYFHTIGKSIEIYEILTLFTVTPELDDTRTYLMRHDISRQSLSIVRGSEKFITFKKEDSKVTINAPKTGFPYFFDLNNPIYAKYSCSDGEIKYLVQLDLSTHVYFTFWQENFEYDYVVTLPTKEFKANIRNVRTSLILMRNFLFYSIILTFYLFFLWLFGYLKLECGQEMNPTAPKLE